MKIQCDVCEKAEASVLCCADEAALCWACDEKVHAANKLAEKHQRVPLLSCHNSSSSSSQHPIPRCDICQEKAGYFFCLEDRALLCRQCDVSIHSSSSSTSTTPYVSSHQRFLLTGVKLDTNNYNNNSQHGRQQNNRIITNAAAASSPNPTIDVSNDNNKHCWDTFSSVAETPTTTTTTDHLGFQQPHWPSPTTTTTTTTTDHLGVQQPHWPSDYQFHNTTTNTTTDCFDHYYEFSPSEFGSSRSISSSQ